MLRFVGRFAGFFLSIMISVLLGSVECRAQSATADALSPPILPANTSVILRLTKNLYKKDAKPGEPVEFEVGYDVVVNGQVLVQRGAVVNGSVRQMDHRGKGPTEVLIDLGPAQTISGETVRLKPASYRSGSDDAASVGAEALPLLPALVIMDLFEKKVLLKQGELWNGVWVVAHVTENVALDPAKLKVARAQLGESLRQGGLPESSVGGSGYFDTPVRFKAHLLHQAGDLDGAIEVCQQALAAKPESLGSEYAWTLFSGDRHYDIAQLFREKHDFAHAIPEYRTAVQLQPKNNAYLIGLVNALADSGDLDTALSEAKEAIRAVPEAPYFHYLLGRLLVKKNDPDAAIVELQWASKGKNGLPQAHCELGRAWELKGDLSAALREYHNALHPYGGDTECRAPYDRLRLQLKK